MFDALDMLDLLFIVGTLLMLWSVFTNQRTHRQRGEMIDAVSREGRRRIHAGLPWDDLYTQLNSVSYGQHHWLLMTFRDPLAYYPDELREIMTKRNA